MGRSDVSDSKIAALLAAEGRSVGLLRLKMFAALCAASGSVGRVESRSFPCHDRSRGAHARCPCRPAQETAAPTPWPLGATGGGHAMKR